jgi:Fe-S-cluster formation regulator IscX/YfhJ
MAETFTWHDEDIIATALLVKFPNIEPDKMTKEEIRLKVVDLKGFSGEPYPPSDEYFTFISDSLRSLKESQTQKDQLQKEREQRDKFINSLSPEAKANYLRGEVCP